MGASSSRPGGAITSINVTPLVDVTLVLLVIFMVTAKLVVNHHALPVDLPKAASAEAIQEILSVELAPDGRVRLDGVAVPSDERLIALAREAVRRAREARAIIQADGAVSHQKVMHVLDLLRQAGIVKIGFGVRPITAPSGKAGP
jgi:biopolymer transport protein ExbD